MEESFLKECGDYAYICVDDLIAALVDARMMSRIEAFSFMFRLMKGSSEYAPIKIYRKPVQCLPFDDYEEVEQIDRDFIMAELRDAAYRELDSYSVIDYVSRKALLVRFQAAGMTLPEVLSENTEVETSSNAGQGRVSTATKVALIALMESQGISVETNARRAAAILSSMIQDCGYSYIFNKDTVANWHREATQHKAKKSNSAA
ncbi:hypothetical protein ABF229_000961 [Yersinia ruckeri]